jgi:hydroxymethylpyrimidine pyrophosphatase-like HAD family hydrolase
MRFRVLACDYDNTLARHGVTGDAAVSALRGVASTGRRLVLVTGRVLEELVDVFGELGVFDRVVVENGGVLHDPATGGQRLLGPPVPSELVVELRDAGIEPLAVGRVICSTRENNESLVVEALRRVGLPRQLIFNKDSLMLLPQGVDKVSGLQAALEELHETMASTVAVGDAENDIAMLDAAGAGVAVANALDDVKAHADIVLERGDGQGVSALCRALAEDDLRGLLEPQLPNQVRSARI